MGFNGRTYTQACAHFSSALLSFVASPLQGHTSLSEVLLSPTAPPFFLKVQSMWLSFFAIQVLADSGAIYL